MSLVCQKTLYSKLIASNTTFSWFLSISLLTLTNCIYNLLCLCELDLSLPPHGLGKKRRKHSECAREELNNCDIVKENVYHHRVWLNPWLHNRTRAHTLYKLKQAGMAIFFFTCGSLFLCMAMHIIVEIVLESDFCIICA